MLKEVNVDTLLFTSMHQIPADLGNSEKQKSRQCHDVCHDAIKSLLKKGQSQETRS